MTVRFQRSVDHAIKLLDTPSEYSDYIIIKIAPTDRGCYCTRCCPETWHTIAEYISPDGPIVDGPNKNEGDVLIHTDDSQFVLECHETGPEVVLYLGATFATIGLLRSVIDLIYVILSARQAEKRTVFRYKLTTVGDEGILQEEVLELEGLNSVTILAQIQKYVESSMNKKDSNSSFFCMIKDNQDSIVKVQQVIRDFKSFVERQAYKDIFIGGRPQENIARALLQAFLPQRSYREVPVRGGQTDILVFCKQGRYLFEVKIWRGPEYYLQGLRELEEYIIGESDDSELVAIFYIVFDATQSHRAQEYLKSAFTTQNLSEHQVNVVVVNISLPQPSKKS